MKDGMDIEQAFLLLLGVASAGLGWFANQLYHAIETLRKDLTDLEIQIGSEYVRYDRLQDMLKPVLSGIEEIKESLKHKADK
jgi:hypothetical protein